MLKPPGGSVCTGNTQWACWGSSDCGSSGPCKPLAMAGVCNGVNWGCRQDSDCGTNGPCWINPGPTG